MNIPDALKIIRILAEGVDPRTGEVLPDESPYNSPQVLRALFAAIQELEKAEIRGRKEQSLPPNAGKPWDRDEDRLLAERYDHGMTIEQLAQQHRRTTGAIQARLERLGIINQTESDRQ